MSAVVKAKRSVDMTQGGILKNLIKFSLPLMATTVLQLLFNAADMVVVGQWVGDDALGAVGCTNSIVNLILNLFIGMSGGAGIVLARAYGAKNREYAERALHTAMIVSVAAGIIVTIIGVTMSGIMLQWLGTPDAIFELARTYLTIYFAGAIFNLVYNFGASMLRAMGDTERPLKFLVIGGVLNVIVNIISVTVFNMGVAGVALATIFSQAVSAILVVLALFKEGAYYVTLSPKKFVLDRAVLKETLRLGVPSGVSGMLFSLSNTTIQSAVNKFGETVVSGCSTSSTIEHFFIAPYQALNLGALNIVSQNYGAKRFDRIKKCTWITAAAVVGVCGALAVVFLLLKEQLFGLFTNSPDVANAGIERFEITICTHALCGLMSLFNENVRGMGVSLSPTIITLIGTCVFRIAYINIVVPLAPMLSTIYFVYPVSWAITGLALLGLFIGVYKRKKFAYELERQVKEQEVKGQERAA